MQYDPSKQGYNNQYPPPNQQFGGGAIYPPNPPPPAYTPYPQQPGAGSNYLGSTPPGAPYYVQQPQYQQQPILLTPGYRSYGAVQVWTPITSGLRSFLIISGIVSLILGILAIGLEIGLIINSYGTYYRGLWAGGYLLGAGISMLVVACQPAYALVRLTVTFIVALILCVIGLILSIVNVAISNRCTCIFCTCNGQLAVNLQVVILVVFILAFIQCIVNLVVIHRARTNTLAAGATPVANH